MGTWYACAALSALKCWQTAHSCCCCHAQVTQSLTFDHFRACVSAVTNKQHLLSQASCLTLMLQTGKHAELHTCTSALQKAALAVQHTKEWWLGACLSTAIPVIYSFTGGMRASLVTDVAQSVTCIGFLIALVIVLGVNAPASFGSWNPAGKLRNTQKNRVDMYLGFPGFKHPLPVMRLTGSDTGCNTHQGNSV